MRWLLCLLVACATEPTPFVYELQQRPGGTPETLLHLEFDEYAAAIDSGPYTVTVAEGTTMKDVTKRPGICQQYTCTGPLELEVMMLTVDDFRQNVLGFTCVGVEGTYGAGVDLTLIGACAR